MVSTRLQGLYRSLRVYHGDPLRNAAMDRLYSQFLMPGTLAFDIGSHVGDRICSFRRLGARVVALEPQPIAARLLRLLYGTDSEVIIVPVAAGALPGTLQFHINTANPTVSTASPMFVAAAKGAGGWEGQVWDRTINVPVTTLDALIATFGVPAFAKIDVEGFEDSVLEGLSRPVKALSFEFTTIARDVSERCLDRLSSLGSYRFNLALGESQHLSFDNWVGSREMVRHLHDLPHEANSGDVYAVLDQ